MGVHRRDEDTVKVVESASKDPVVRARWESKIVTIPGDECWWWTGAISGRGHGRFWINSHRVIVAHRFSYAIANGASALNDVDVLGHRCDNPLCQRVGQGHIIPSSHLENRREWAARRNLIGSPLADQRGARARAQYLRDLAKDDPQALSDHLGSLRARYGQQMPLWAWSTPFRC